MAFWVIAESSEQFNAWMDHQLQSALEPADEETARGRKVFLSSACVLCHAIRGTDAGAQAGPDLTHFASRKTIAAGTLPNNKGNLAGWIADPQNIKPGTHMATVPIQASEMQPLIDYLESLK
jgi:cytochrome c oxidase subunit 2